MTKENANTTESYSSIIVDEFERPALLTGGIRGSLRFSNSDRESVLPRSNRQTDLVEDIDVQQEKEITIRLPEEYMERIPTDFNLGRIGRINLIEAERIADETLLLSEDDLIQEAENISFMMEDGLAPDIASKPSESEFVEEDSQAEVENIDIRIIEESGQEDYSREKNEEEEEIAHRSAVKNAVVENEPRTDAASELENVDVERRRDNHELFYRDDDLLFIDDAVLGDGISDYMTRIDEYHQLDPSNSVPDSVVTGMDAEELDAFHEAIMGSAELSSGAEPERQKEGPINVKYELPDNESLLNEEKASIEEEVSSQGAYIYEEDIGEITRLLQEYRDYATVDSDIKIEADAESKVSIEKVQVFDDITDRIVIIDDELDIDRFVREFPDNKQNDIRRLLKYLDGLFEKLPEDIVRQFADSEYFDIYVNVLNELGV